MASIFGDATALGPTWLPGRRVVQSCWRVFRLKQIYQKFRDYTMIPEPFYVDNLVLAGRMLEVPGCVVECGVWRGGMSGGIAEVMGPSREYFLFDSFEGLPCAREIDGPAARAWQANVKSPGYYD